MAAYGEGADWQTEGSMMCKKSVTEIHDNQ
jgi:hypothetical protein